MMMRRKRVIANIFLNVFEKIIVDYADKIATDNPLSF